MSASIKIIRNTACLESNTIFKSRIMSNSHLMTDWICVCAEGETVDGREIKRKWITDAAETYNPQLYTALLWPEHSRNFGNMGQVLELMSEEDGEGILRLYARLCPNLSLMQANVAGQLIFCSAEFTPDGNFRGTGKSYLEGLGVTDEPASVYTERMRFNSRNKNKRYGALKPLVIDKVTPIKEAREMATNKNKSKWRSLFNIQDEEQPGEETAPDDKIQVLAQAVADLEAQVLILKNKAEATDTAVEDVVADVEVVKEVVDTEDFAKLRDNLPGIIKNFGKLENKVTKLPNKFSKGEGKKPFSFL
ncbi:putative capsid scaffolding protein [Yersinia kristensenii]|uniref:Putative capsid scaffolding protein n=2 Tax=Yersinia kristensenii TaxID=28152 RepID=A0A0T9KXB3_YERKR|nr:putative capsid scaffolding protein [Yersinia kristensenii]